MEKMKKRLSYLFMATAILFTSMPFPGMGKVMAAEGNKQARNIISDRNEKELSFAVDEAGGKDLWAKEKDDDVNASTIKGKLRIPEIPGYTLVQNTEDIDLEKYYILVSVGADNTPYAFYGMNTGFFPLIERAEEIEEILTLAEEAYGRDKMLEILAKGKKVVEEVNAGVSVNSTQIEIDGLILSLEEAIGNVKGISISGNSTKVYDAKPADLSEIRIEKVGVEDVIPVYFEKTADGFVKIEGTPVHAGEYYLAYGAELEENNAEQIFSNKIPVTITKAPITIEDVTFEWVKEEKKEDSVLTVKDVLFKGLAGTDQLKNKVDYIASVSINEEYIKEDSDIIEVMVTVNLEDIKEASSYTLKVNEFVTEVKAEEKEIDPGVSDNNPGVSDNDPGVSDNDPGVSDNDPGVSDNDPDVSDNDSQVSYDNIWVSGLEAKEYTGAKQTQKLKVYDGDRLLIENADYTISYKNNVNAYEFTEEDIEGFEALYRQNPKTREFGNFVAKKAPQVVIKMKGNYTGTRSLFFQIKKQDISDEDLFTIDDITVTNNGKKQSPVPVVTWNYNGKNLKNKKDFTVKEYVAKTVFQTPSTDPDGYILTVEGKGNFTGTRQIRLVITPDKNTIAMSQVKVSSIKAMDYTGEEVKPSGFTVKYKKTVLTEGVDFEVEYENNVGAGTASMILTGKGTSKDGYTFVGSKRVNFKINGYTMNKVKVSGLTSQIFTGDDIEPLSISNNDGKPAVTVQFPATKKLAARTLTEEDYTVVYEKNVVKGTATAILTGVAERGITGTKKVTFKIEPAALTNASESGFDLTLTSDVSGNDHTVYFTKGGAKPAVTIVKDGNTALVEGRDYTVSYKKNKNVGDGALAVIKGKGNYKGTVTLSFKIEKKPVSDVSANGVWIVVNDKVENTKKNSWKQNFKIWDADGKALTNKDAQLKTAVYTVYQLPADYSGPLKEGDELKDATAVLPVGAKVQIKVILTGNYTGEVTGVYRIIKSGYDISKAKIKLLPQQYTGEAVEIDGNDNFKTRILKVNGSNITLSLEECEGQTFKVIEGSYINHLKKGTAKVTLRGVGEYGGIKTVTYKIGGRSIVTWLDVLFQYWK